MLNVNYKQNLDSNLFIDFKTCYTLFLPGTALRAPLVFFDVFGYPSNKRVIYRPELKLQNRVLGQNGESKAHFSFF